MSPRGEIFGCAGESQVMDLSWVLDVCGEALAPRAGVLVYQIDSVG